MIVVENVTKKFTHKNKTINVLNGISLECDKNQVFGLLGPNGAGKTTLLRILATIMKPTSGRVTIDGFDSVKEYEEIRKRIGYLSSETGIYDRFTPREILRFFGQISGMAKEHLDTRINRVLEEMDIEDYADRRIDRFSTGMRQKVSIARSLIHDPQIIIFDEPTNGLDVMARKIVKNSILKLKQMGKCVILSTHLMNDVDELCDKIGIIHKGQMLSYGSTEEIKNQFNAERIEDVFFTIIGDNYEAQ